MKQWIKYALLNSILGLLIVGIIALKATGKEYLIFAIAVPIAAFLAAGLFWNLILKKSESQTNGQIILAGILTGTVSHYFTFIFLSVGMNICFWKTGNCTNSLGEPPAGLLSALTGAFAFCFFTILGFGWITVPASILLGIVIRRNKNNGSQQGI